MNDVKILGNITNQPELKISESGTRYTFFTIATNYKDKATFIPVTAFNGLAEWICKYHKKGTRICVSGYLDGGTKENDYRIKVIANEGYFADRTQNRPDEIPVPPQAEEEQRKYEFANVTTEEQLPF